MLLRVLTVSFDRKENPAMSTRSPQPGKGPRRILAQAGRLTGAALPHSRQGSLGRAIAPA